MELKTDDNLVRLVQGWVDCGLAQARDLVDVIDKYLEGEYPISEIDKVWNWRFRR